MGFIRAIIVLSILLALLFVVSKASQQPTLVSLQWGNTTLSTSAATASALLLFAGMVLFYLGQLTSWAFNLPQAIRNFLNLRQQQTTLQKLTSAYAALAQFKIPEAENIASTIKPSQAELPLYLLLKLQLHKTLNPKETEIALSIPAFKPLLEKPETPPFTHD